MKRQRTGEAQKTTKPGREEPIVAVVSALLAFASLQYCFQHNLLLLYGDAVAHLHIARRVLDSLNPGFRQLGSVWLPLPHVLLIPLVQPMSWWQSGMAGALPSMMCYVAGCVGLYRLARLWLPASAATVAAAFYGLNPGLLYMQTTAMTEPLFLAEMIWSALLVGETSRALEKGEQDRARRLLLGVGLILVAAVYTRYDGWIYAAFAWLVVAAAMIRRHQWRQSFGGAFALFTTLLLAAPLLWMAYNAKQFHDPLDFLRGPYSAKAIELRTATPGMPHYPGWHSMKVAALYFLKAAEGGAAPLAWANDLLWLAIAGTLAAVVTWRDRGISAALLLWIPVPFYAYSIAYGSVPLFIPLWWPHSWYNTRYGMELLPAFALFVAMLVAWLMAFVDAIKKGVGRWVFVAALGLILVNSAALLRATPLVLQEAVANSKTRIPFERILADALVRLPADVPILMYTSEHIGAVQQAGIPLKRTINETDYQLWQAALVEPAKAAPIVIATEGDPLSKAVAAHPEGLTLQEVICSTGQPCARIYRSDTAH
jgi:hypothetical protein